MGYRWYSGSNRVKRGGSWNNNANNCRSANRNNNNPDNSNNNIGFRVVRRYSPVKLQIAGICMINDPERSLAYGASDNEIHTCFPGYVYRPNSAVGKSRVGRFQKIKPNVRFFLLLF